MFSRSSVCPQGECLPLVPGVSATLPRQTSPRQTPQGRHPLDRLPSRQTSPWTHPPAQCMLGYTPPPSQYMLGYTHTLPSACWETDNKRAVRIPLECILVARIFSLTKNKTTSLLKRPNPRCFCI